MTPTLLLSHLSGGMLIFLGIYFMLTAEWLTERSLAYNIARFIALICCIGAALLL